MRRPLDLTRFFSFGFEDLFSSRHNLSREVTGQNIRCPSIEGIKIRFLVDFFGNIVFVCYISNYWTVEVEHSSCRLLFRHFFNFESEIFRNYNNIIIPLKNKVGLCLDF